MENYYLLRIMSWDSYIDNIVINSKGNCDKVCIIGKDGTGWTSEDNPKALKLTPNERAMISSCFNKGDFSHFQGNGVMVEGQKYKFLREEKDVVLAKEKGKGALSIECSDKGVIIAHVKEGGDQGSVNVADLLTSDKGSTPGDLCVDQSMYIFYPGKNYYAVYDMFSLLKHEDEHSYFMFHACAKIFGCLKDILGCQTLKLFVSDHSELLRRKYTSDITRSESSSNEESSLVPDVYSIERWHTPKMTDDYGQLKLFNACN